MSAAASGHVSLHTRRRRHRSRPSSPTMLGAFVALLAILTIAGCGIHRDRGAPSAHQSAAPLRVGTSGDYRPFSYRDADGTLAGFDVAVARAYAAERGREVVFVPFRWPELRERLVGGDFDVAMSGVTVRGDRLADGIMTAAVARSSAVLVAAAPARSARAGADGRTRRNLHAFDRATARIAVNRGGHLEHVARQRFPHATIVPLDENRLLPCVLRDGSADAVVTDTLELATFAASDRCPPTARPRAGRHHRDDQPVTIARLSHDRKAYWIPASRAELATDLDDWLRARERDGTLATLRERYFGRAAVESAVAAPDEATLIDLIARRLLLMPLVAAAKRAGHLAIEDRAREEAVESAAARRAIAAGIDADAYVALVHAEIDAAKAVQRATGDAGGNAGPSLADLRAAIDRLDAAILAAAGRAVPIDATADEVTALLRDDADVAGVDDGVLRELTAAIVGLRAAAFDSARIDATRGSDGGAADRTPPPVELAPMDT